MKGFDFATSTNSSFNASSAAHCAELCDYEEKFECQSFSFCKNHFLDKECMLYPWHPYMTMQPILPSPSCSIHMRTVLETQPQKRNRHAYIALENDVFLGNFVVSIKSDGTAYTYRGLTVTLFEEPGKAVEEYTLGMNDTFIQRRRAIAAAASLLRNVPRMQRALDTQCNAFSYCGATKECRRTSKFFHTITDADVTTKNRVQCTDVRIHERAFV
ncbi:PREDICTED: uncharacterized protein LOC106808523 [Priapulus caudatus]|uniref:Uncharacterized protein LOC106808523 n=1 Tax=Priapulus caudatus TaxID=37621 RepID=A0ABM1E3J4_PRICU|nr:PREDICTED: uncharacterized protein LOC106808523 [Priapulus caudatus]